jgi:uncharacterized OsmC-like protein
MGIQSTSEVEMSTQHIKESIEAAVGYLRQHPEEARYRDSAARAVIEDDLQCRIVDPEGRELKTDMTTGIGGSNTAPSPGWLMRAASASCTATLIAMRAAQNGVSLGELEVLVDSESDDQGILGMDDSVPAGPLSVRVQVRIEGEPDDRESLEQVVDWAMQHCPVTDAIRRAVQLIGEVEVR